MTDHRSVLVISTVISSSTFAFLVIMLPLMFINVQQRKSFMLQSVNLCRSEVLDIRKRQAKEFRSESLELKGRRLPRDGYAGYQSQPISALFYNSCCSCKQGPPGLPGKRALPGKNGRPGELGMLGRDGKAGAYLNAQQIAEESCQLCPPSVRGPPGTPGLKGPLGPAGASGLPGIPGISGEKGIRGPVGSNGKPGNAGPQGPIGDPGRTIFSAPPGKSGPSGLPGPRGAPGSAGFDGQSGERGLKGPRGYQGERGPPGSPGQLGPRGPTGLFGTLGETKLTNSKMPSQTPKQKAEVTTIGTEAPLRIYASKTFKSQNRGTPYLRRRDRI